MAPKEIHILQILAVASNDVEKEISELEKSIHEINQINEEYKISFELLKIRAEDKSALSINTSLTNEISLKIKTADLLVGIFWKQPSFSNLFFTAYESWKINGFPQIKLYFKQKPFMPVSSNEATQLRKLLEFKESFPENEVTFNYDGAGNFHEQVYLHLKEWANQNYDKRDRQYNLIEKHKEPISRSNSELLKEYKSWVYKTVSTASAIGYQQPLNLENIFIPINLVQKVENLAPSDPELSGLMDVKFRKRSFLTKKSFDISEDSLINSNMSKSQVVSSDNLIQKELRTIITGAPGSGKTTILKYLALQELKKVERWVIFFELKTISAEDFELAKNLPALIFNKAIANPLNLNKIEYENFRKEFFIQLNKGKVSIFLDGLDEVGSQKLFDDLLLKTIDFINSKKYRKNSFILASRPFALRKLSNSSEELQQMEILPLDKKTINKFVHIYSDEFSVEQKILNEINNSIYFGDLASIPVMLVSIIELFKETNNLLPHNRLTLLDNIIKLLIFKHDLAKDTPRLFFRLDDPHGTLKRDFLEQIAYEKLLVNEYNSNTEASRFIISSDEILDSAKNYIYSLTLGNISPQTLADDIKSTPLLREIADNQFAFIHLTLQEFLAAKKLSRRNDSLQIFCRTYFNNVLAEQEILPMVLGIMQNADQFYKALEELPESLLFTNLRLRVRGLGYGAVIDEHLLIELLDTITRILVNPSNDEEPFRRLILQSLSNIPNNIINLLEDRIIPYLSETFGYVSEKAAEVLSVFGTEKSFDALVSALNIKQSKDEFGVVSLASGSNEQFIVYICRALVRINPDNAVEILGRISTSYSYGEIDRLLKQIGTEEAYRILLKRQKRGMDWMSASIAENLDKQSQDKSIQDVLLNALNSNNNEVRGKAVEILGYIGKEEFVEPVTKCLHDPDVTVRWQAAFALEKINSERAVIPLTEALFDREEIVRRSAAIALWYLASEAAVDPLINSLSDSSDDVKYYAANALGRTQSTRAIEPLLRLLKTGDAKPRTAVIYALAQIKSLKAMPQLIESLSDNHPPVRAGAAYALGSIRAKEAIIPLTNLLSDVSDEVREAAIRTIGLIGLKDSAQELINILNTRSNIKIKEAVLEALGKIGTPETIKPLMEAYSTFFFTHEAAEGLAQIDPKILSTSLPPILHHESKDVRRNVAEIIGYYSNDPNIFNELSRLAEGDPDTTVRYIADEAAEKYARKLELFGFPIAKLAENAGRLQSLEETRSFIAHEVRSTLGPLRSYAQMLNKQLTEQDADPDKLQELTQRIIKQTDAAYGIVDHYVDYTKPIIPEFELVDINLVLDQVVTEYRLQCQQQEVEIEYRFSNEVMAEIDRNMIKQVLRNVFANALDSIAARESPNSEPFINKITLRTNTQKRSIIISISDTGIGINPEHKTRLFELGFTTKLGKQGSGIGLALSRRIVEEGHTGIISLENNKNKIGATVNILLPISQKDKNGR